MGNSSNKRKTQNKSKSEKKTVDLDKTDVLDIVFDDERLDDDKLLDNSFVDKKKKKRNNDIEILDVDDYSSNNKKKVKNNQTSISEKRSFFIFDNKLIVLVCSSFVLGFIICLLVNYKTLFLNNKKVVNKIETKIVNDDNYVFLGDSIFEYYDLEKYYEGLPVVNSGVSRNRTVDVLDNMARRVYRYNPSKVFVLIGTNDILNKDKIYPETADNIRTIIKEIKKNRPYTQIYVQSIYPINDTDDSKILDSAVYHRSNDNIMEINELIEDVCNDEDVTYIDMYSLLVDDVGNLKIEYTTDGLHISDEGYEVITDELMKYINK